jgi:hypothetical protein
MVTADDVRALALSFAGVREAGEPGRPAFAVRGRVFATLWTPTKLFVEEHGPVDLVAAEAPDVARVLEEAWARVAPRRIRREHLQP